MAQQNCDLMTVSNNSTLDEKVERATIAAGEVFLRYGYARTTMGDIAHAAGMSRPALYLLFPGKEQVFAAATMNLAVQRLEGIRDAIRDQEGLRQKLVTGFEMLLLRVFELQQTVPDARDMDDLSFPVVREIYAMFVRFFADIIAEHGRNRTSSAEQVAKVLLFGLRGLREVAESHDDYAQMIRLHVSLVCDRDFQKLG